MADKRRLIELLPQFLQENDQLNKYFNTTVDPLFQPEDKRKFSGYIGRFPEYYDSETDFYVAAGTSEKQFYQFEPGMISKDANDDITLIQTYPDLVNHLRFQGANVDDHNRLFKQKYYSWAPPINIDKFVNFTNYYWYPEGPTPIDVTGVVSNPIDVETDILGQASYTSPNGVNFYNGMKITFGATNVTPAAYQNGTYIIEGVGRAILLVHEDDIDPLVLPLEATNTDKEYITIERGSQDQNPWSRTNHWYHKNQILLIDESDNLIETDELVLWDADPWDTTPWDATVTTVTPAFNLDIERQAKRPIIEFLRNLELYNFGTYGQTATYLDDTTTNVFLDIHGQTYGSISYDGNVLVTGDTILVTADTNDSINNRIYTVSQIGTDYSLTLAVTGQSTTGDPVTGDSVLILDGDESGKHYHYNGTSYTISQRKTTDSQAPLFNLYDNDGNYIGDTSVYKDNNFVGNEIFSYKEGDDSSINDVDLGFPVVYKNFTQVAEIVFENNLNQTYSYKVDNDRVEIPRYYYYKVTGDDYVDESYDNSWYLSSIESTQEFNNFYEVPMNLQANPDYNEVTEITRSESLAHFISILINQEGNTETNFTKTLYKNSARDLSKGTEIVQNEASMLKLMFMAASEDYDYMIATKFISREYRRFRNRVLNKVKLFIDQGMANTGVPYSQWLDDAIKSINTSKKNTTLFTFNNTRVLPSGPNYENVTYNAAGTDFEIPNGQTFDPAATCSSDVVDAVSVYVNNELLLINYDYTVNGSTVTLVNAVTANDTVEIRYYADIRGSFMPASGAVMGLTAVYKPERYVDDTYSEPRKVIQCHDGSIHIEYGDERDDVVFEMEKRIYNTIHEIFKGDREVYFSPHEVLPGYFRDNDYSYEDYADVLTPIFTTWATQAGINWTNNTEDTTFDQGDWKTWNWSDVNNVDGERLNGSWRAIYHYYYDTDRPHTHPWEMLGFSEKPTWWESEYGTSYASTNSTMWSDIKNGIIKQGTRSQDNSGIDPLYVRPTLLSILPVDSNGDLRSPFDIGIAVANPTVVSAQYDWAPGDWSPAENAFWRSSERSFFMSQLLYLMKPAKWVHLGWETETVARATVNRNQLLNDDFGYRPMLSQLTVDIENGRTKAGIQQWLANRLQFKGNDIATTLGDDLRGISANMLWKAESFLYKDNLSFRADSYSPGSTNTNVTIKDEDINVELYESDSVREAFYGGVIVEWTGTGFQVVGYDSLKPYFTIIPSITTGKSSTISVGTTAVKEYKQGQYDVVMEIPYGYEFTTKQDLYDFLISYQRYLETEGWVFDEYDSRSNEILNWRFAGKEFLFWAEDVLDAGAFITLSPSANNVTFYTETGYVQNVEEIVRGTYSILDRTGSVIEPKDTTVFRMNETFQVYPTNDQGIYALRLSVKEIENIVVFENTTRFNDLIYDPLLNLRQNRLKVFGTGTNGWNGRLEASGFVVDNNNDRNLIPNYEKMANDIINYFDIENAPEDDKITDLARHLIGYQRREYLDNLFVDRDTSYQFYQGFIHQKGSRNSLERLLRTTAIASATDLRFLEEWAIRVSQYGATDSKKFFEIGLLSSEIKVNPQMISFTDGTRPEVTSDYVIEVPPNDSRWVLSNNLEDINKFSLRPKNTRYKKDLPNAGYVKIGETDYQLAKPELFLDATNSVYSATLDETVWIALDSDGYMRKHSWDVRVLKDSTFYAFSNQTDLQEIYTYKKESFTGDGVTANFTISPSYTATSSDIRAYVDTIETAFTTANNIVTITSTPGANSTVEIYYQETPSVGTMLVFEDDTRENGLVETYNDRSVTIRVVDNVLLNSNYEKTPIYEWQSLRYASISSLDDAAATYTNNYLYFDSGDNGWEVYQTTNGVYSLVRAEEDLIDIESINKALIYDYELDRIEAKITTYDPFKGIIPGVVDAEITYKLDYDPARYNSGDNVFERVWGVNQVGKVWWDLSQVAYLYYEMDTVNYKYQNWGQIFPGTEIKLYEWVRSPVPPSEWAGYVTSAQTVFNYSYSGTVKDIDTDDGPNWVEKEEDGVTFYYFWVEGAEHVPLVDYRSTSLFDMTQILSDPNGQGIKWLSILDQSTFVLGNIENNLNDATTVLQFNYTQEGTENNIHNQWELLREDDTFSNINDRHWNKMRDSLVGYDDLGKEVPDVNLRGNARYGHMIRPRQTWFKDKLEARRVFITAINSMLAEINLYDTIDDYDANLSEEDLFARDDNIVLGTVANPTVTLGDQIDINGDIVTFSSLNGVAGIADDINFYISHEGTYAEIVYDGLDQYIQIVGEDGQSITIIDVLGSPTVDLGLPSGLSSGSETNFIVNSRTERNALTTISIGEDVLILNDEELRNYWTVWEFLGGNTSDDHNWKLTEIQAYKTSEFWDYIDWYEGGYDSSVVIDVVYDTLSDLDTSLDSGTVAKVKDNGTGRWALYVLADSTWEMIALEAATIEFKDTLYDPVTGLYGFDNTLYDDFLFDAIPNIEFRKILDALRNDILINSLEIEQNRIFFKMINHAHTESTVIDWAFKTSYLFVVGFTQQLDQPRVYEYDGFESLIDYINETKPYHTKIKDVVRSFATATDIANISVIDYDKPVYINDDGDSVILDVDDSDDQVILNSGEWANWFNEYQIDLSPTVPKVNNVRKLKTTIKLDRISAIKEGWTSGSFERAENVNTPYYDTTIDSTSAKDTKTVNFLDDYIGSFDDVLSASALGGMNFVWKLDGDLLDTGYKNESNNGTATGGSAVYTDSLIPSLPNNQSLLFDSSVRILIPNNNDINAVSGSVSSGKINFVFQADNIHSASPQVIYEQGGTTEGYNVTLYKDTDGISRIYFTIYKTSGSAKDVMSYPVDIGKTYLVTIWFSIPGDEMEMYINGELVASKAGPFNVDPGIPSHTEDINFGGTGTGSNAAIGPINNTALVEDDSYFQGKLQYFSHDRNQTLADTLHTNLWNAFNNVIEIHDLSREPAQKTVSITSSGITTSSIVIEGNTEPDFTGTTQIIHTFTTNETAVISYNDIVGYPYLRANVDNHTYNESVSITSTLLYENQFSRLLDYYAPSGTQVNLLDYLNYYYTGTIVDGLNLNLDAGWDSSPWDFAGWDFDEDINSFFDYTYDGGSFYVYVGDNTTGAYNLPDNGVDPWYVAVTDPAGTTTTELVLTTDYTISSGVLTLTTGGGWMTGSNLSTDYKLSILDRSYESLAEDDIVIDGNSIVQPRYDNYPEEIAPLVLKDSIVTTVVTTAGPLQIMLNAVTSAVTSDIITFADAEPIVFTTSGISGDTVIIEGSNSGLFDGEETTIETITTNTSISVPDSSAGYSAFTYYRVRVSVYSAGTITVTAEIDYAPEMMLNNLEYNATDGTGPYAIGQNVEETDDALIFLNGIALNDTVDYTVSTGANTFTFSAAQTNGDLIDVYSWNTSGISNTDPTWVAQTYTSATIDLSSISVDPDPTEPRENSMFVFGDTGSGFRRLTPPEARYYIGNGSADEFNLNGDVSIGSGNVTVWVNNILQTGGGTDYTYNEGGSTAPSAAVAAGGATYAVNDVLTVSGGTGTAVTLKVLTVSAGAVTSVAVVNPGLYTSVPGNPVSTTGGSGTGATFNLTNYSTIEDTITFTTAPSVGDKIGIRILGSEDYTINPANTTMTVSAGLTLTTDDIAFYSFRTNDTPMNIKTQTFDGVSTAQNGKYVYPIDQAGATKDRTIVTVYTNGGTIGGIKLSPNDFSIENVAGAWDNTGWDTGGWEAAKSLVKLNSSYAAADKVVITTIAGEENQATITFRDFTGYDNNDEFREYIRLSSEESTTLSITLQPDAASITLADATVFDTAGGVAWIGGERIEYLQRTGTTNGTLTGLSRGSKGTRKNKVHKAGETVYVGNSIPQGETEIFNSPELSLLDSTTDQAVYIQEKPGGYKGWT